VGVLELGDAADVAGHELADGRRLLALEDEQVPEPLGLLLAGVVDGGVGA
jgi:hypothetical protein